MHNIVKKSLCLALLLSSYSIFSSVSPYYSIRSQSENAARELVGAGWNTQINLCDMDRFYGSVAITPEYTRSFRGDRICDCLFGCSAVDRGTCSSSCNTNCGSCGFNDCGCIRISGSKVTNRGNCDWLADYFGLPTDYNSVVTFKPQIDNFLVDFNFYIGLDEWVQGLYFRVHAPIVHTRWNLNMCECIETKGVNPHWAGYFNSAQTTLNGQTYGIAREHLVSDFKTFISGHGKIDVDDINFNYLCKAKMDCNKRTETALSDVQMAIGWNAFCDETHHLGFNIRGAAPTGTRPNGEYLFEAIIGNGHHWELGAGLSGHWRFWIDECEENSLALYCDANFTHLFKTKQCRTFDLCGKPLSRYMLAQHQSTVVTNLYTGEDGSIKSMYQFNNVYNPVANLTTIPVDVSVGVQADIVIMFQYLHNNWGVELGYGFWGKTCETINLNCEGTPFEQNSWALKGDAFMYGFYDRSAEDIVASALSPSQSQATICKGTNNTPNTLYELQYYQNPGVDNKQKAWASNGITDPLYIYLPTGFTDDDQMYTSKDPLFINPSDVDWCGARTKGMSHKVFGHFDYTWTDHQDWVPYIGIGGEVEFGCTCCDDCCKPSCSNCSPCDPITNPCSQSCGTRITDTSCNCCAVSQWGIWLKGGVAFY